MKRKGPGRPAEFTKRVQLSVFLEATELAALYAAAREADVSASNLARSLLVTALRRRRPRPRKDT